MVVPLRRQVYVYPVPVAALSTTLPPEQKEVAPAAVMDAVGAAVTVTVVPDEVVEHPLEVTTTV
jgi:hypothetical protein